MSTAMEADATNHADDSFDKLDDEHESEGEIDEPENEENGMKCMKNPAHH